MAASSACSCSSESSDEFQLQGERVDDMNSEALDVEQLMQRVRVEAAAPRSHPPAPKTSPVAAGRITRELEPPEAVRLMIPEWRALPLQQPVTRRAGDRYCAADVLEYEDREFVQAAYLAVLGRLPDEGGMGTYLPLLRNGTGKVEILRTLRRSPEGRVARLAVPGLASRLAIHAVQQWPIVGRLMSLAAAIVTLPRQQRRQRAFMGRVSSFLEMSEIRTSEWQSAVPGIFLELQAALHNLKRFCASKPGHADLESLETSLELVNEQVVRLTGLLEGKAARQELRASFDEVAGSLRALQDAKAESSALRDTRQQLDEMVGSLRVLQASKAERSLLDETRQQFDELVGLLRMLQASKAERTLLDETRQQLEERLISGIDTEEIERSVAFLEERCNQLALRAEAKADRTAVDEALSRFDDSFRLLREAFATKADRRELTSLTNHLVDLVHAGPTRESVLSLEKHCSSLASQIDASRDLLQANNDVLNGLVEAARTEFRASTAETTSQLRAAIEGLRASKADHAVIEATKSDAMSLMSRQFGEFERSVARVADSKADHAALVATRSELLTRLDAARAELAAGAATIAESKVDRGALETARRELASSFERKCAEVSATLTAVLGQMEAKIDSVRAEKLDPATLDSSQMELKAQLMERLEQVSATVTALERVKVDRAALEAAQAEHKAAVESARAHTEESVRSSLRPFDARVQDIKSNVLDQERRLSILLEETRKRMPKTLSRAQLQAVIAEEDHAHDAMYAAFEDVFRGARSDIKQRQAIYLPYVQSVMAGTPAHPVVDLGCGRGEWLELLRDAGLHATGVDRNRVFLDRCRSLNLDVVEADVIAFLRKQKPNSLGAVTSFHLIEHLPHKTLLTLLDWALHALRPGGLLILETPNPRNLQVGGCNFYLDPTHLRPLPPELTCHVVEARGFVNVEVRELHPVQGQGPVTGGAPMVNDTLNRFFFSPQDYGVIARKA
jgi:SAM-dependent methyltransferase